ncbi:Fc.00g099310.m01.CDS01 [Cosmosporella sp. VM-42]
MGIDSRRVPPLPAPTETATASPSELTVDIPRPTDGKSTLSIPEDGTPLTIPTRGHKASRSQTSLLIEYFEGGKTSPGAAGERRPSVRVRLTPSKKGSRGEHIQVTKGTRKSSTTKRIHLDQLRDSDFFEGDDNSMSSYASATEESNVSRNPIDIEIDRGHRRRRPASPLIPTGETYQPVNPSEISAIPSDSFLDGTGATDLKNSFHSSRGEALATGAVAGAATGAAMDEIKNYKRRTGNRDRVKVPDKSKDGDRHRKSRPKSRTSSVSERTGDDLKSPRRRSSRGHQESAVSGADSSVLSSNLTPSHRSVDTHSTQRSNVSKSSINNPKLLETVEDAIRRLILPELSALKREQSKRESRRSSFTSSATTTTSRDDVSTDRRRSSGQRSDSKRNREARHDYGDSSPLSVSRESLNDGYHYDGDPTTPKRGDLLKAAAAGAAAATAAKALSSTPGDDKTQSEDRQRRERRRRRPDNARSRSLGRDRYAEEYEDDLTIPAPPMPLMSDINPSEVTRASILSADTDRPHSASEELTPVQHVNRGVISDSSTPTPTRSPANFEETLLTKHANVSQGDLTALPRGEKKYEEEYDDQDGYGRQLPDQYDEEETREVSDPGDYPDQSYEDTYYATQDVPPPLKYVPYQAGARGLSPIPSVSGYTEGGSEHQPRNSRSMHSTSDAYSALERSPEHPRNSRSTASLNSLRDRGFEPVSPTSSAANYRNTTYTDDSELDRVTSGQAVRGIGANPNFVHPPLGVESAVASLVDGSMLDQSVLTSQSGYGYNDPRDSQLSYDDQSKISVSELSRSSRGPSPDKRSLDSRREMDEERHPTPGARSYQQSHEFSEYELDEHGRKVPKTSVRTRSPTASEAAITAGAVGAAAAALKAAQERKQPVYEEDEEFVPAGVFRNKSFKERTLEGHEPRNTPAHSVDRLSYDEPPKMSASGMPDWDNPMPELGFVDDDLHTNPSIIQERLDGEQGHGELSGRTTPTQRDIGGYHHEEPQSKEGGGLGITEAAGAAALGAAAGMPAAHAHSREPSHDHDEWQRTSDERKRDTLVTNPYEDASPIANPTLNEGLLSRGMNAPYSTAYHTGSPGFGQKYDEGYMSNGPNRTPDVEPKGKALGGLSGIPTTIGEDPFYVTNKDHARHLSGMSQGMASPFYDAATGQGIDRIENKDIVALMQHLMVRDAQRSARDTEIVALLMNAALEMRNSFREMKDLIQDTGDDVIFAGVENTEKLQKAINGPRPYPGSRSIQSASQLDSLTDAAAKKKNLWKRALQGLSAKGSSDLGRIEDMLMQLLGEVDVLKTQTAPPVSTGGHSPSSFNNLQPEGQYEQDRGYEPEGNSTASHASQSGHLSLTQSRNASGKLANERKFSDHRISTVQENEEEYQYDHPSPSAERTDPNLLTPGRADIPRGGSVPLDTPPHPSSSHQQPLSAENTPRTEKGKKHKSSGSSSWLPKISRWSGTTSSSLGKAFGRGGKKELKYDDYPPSRSGSSLASYNDDLYEHDHNPYEEDKLHSGFSEQDLNMPAQPNMEPGPTQRELNFTPDDPKYKAHRNSLNLQHPQPRPGQTERFRTALEYSAQEYDNPMTPKSPDWAGSATSLNRLTGNTNTNRYSNASSGGAQQEYWGSSPTGPPRPPKEPMDSPSARTPPRSTRVSKLAKSSPLQHQSDESGYGTMSGTHPSQYTGSPKPENRNLNAALGIPTRRPSGPRAMTPKSPEEDTAREERRRKRDTFGTVGSQNTDDTETF